MKSSQGKALLMASAALPIIIVVTGAALQTFTLLHAQKMAAAQRHQIVFIQASRVKELLNDAGSGMGGFSMTHSPLYMERFSHARQALPKALEDLGDLGPFEGEEAEAVSQLKQYASEALALFAKAEDTLTNPNANREMMGHGIALYRQLKTLGERIQGSVQRLSPQGGTSEYLKAESEMEKETSFLRLLTVVWLLASLLATAVLIVIFKQNGLLQKY
jgi:CHASE3 domain sensor protein